MADPIADLLRRSPLTDAQRADAWDAFHNATDQADLATKLQAMQIPDAIKADLGDRKTTPEPAAQAAPAAPTDERSWTDAAVDALPTIGGLAGGIIGGAGGAAFGVGFGGVPGAVGGATLGGAAGESARQFVNRLRGETAPSTPTEAATSIAAQGGMQGAAEVLGAGVAKAASGTAKAVYRGYLKPSLSQQMAPRANEIVKTALDEALPISRGGTQAANRIINELKTEVDDILAKSGEKVDLHQVAEKVRTFARTRYNKPGVDPADFKAAMDVADKLDAHPSLGLPPGAAPTRVDVSLSKANEVKRALDTSVKETGFGVTTGAKKSTEKAARHEINTVLQKKAASIAPLNARESKLIDAAKAIGRAVEREANNNQLTGVKSMVAAAGGGGLAASGQTDPATAATIALGARIGLHPAVASRAAIVAYRMSKELGVSAASAARLAVYAVSEQPEQMQGNAEQAVQP